MWETWVRSLGWEDPLEKAKATHSSILAWRIPWTVQSDMTERLFTLGHRWGKASNRRAPHALRPDHHKLASLAGLGYSVVPEH